jgi:bla regulator protein BlaR1
MVMEYFLKFSAIIALFYFFYKLFLERETFFHSIRGYFLVGIILAFTLPLVIIPEYIYIDPVFTSQVSQTAIDSQSQTAKSFNPMTIIFSLYGLGVLFFALRFILQLSSLTRFILQLPKKRKGSFVYITTNKVNTPFSFFHYIIYPKKGYDKDELNQVLDHEKVHAKEFHSIDILFTQLMIVFNWFNPIAWLYYKEIQKNLEFIADQGAQTENTPKDAYQYLLLKTVSPNYSMALTSNFYNSLIKKRINMLHKNKSTKMMYAKFIFIIPMLVAFVMTFNTKVIAQEKNVEKHEFNIQMNVEVITKDFSKTDLETLKASLLKQGITLGYKKLKYNASNEIISIAISVENKQGNKTQLQQAGTDAIKPISIKFDSEGALAVGNFEGMENHSMFIHKDGKKVHKNVIVNADGNVSSKAVNSFVFVSDDGTTTHIKTVNGQTVTEEIHGDHGTNVWVSNTGDSTKIQHVKVIEIDGDHDGEKTVIVKEIHKDHNEVEMTVEVSSDNDNGGEKMVFITDDGEKPLIIVDGKELKDGSIDDIAPETIENVNIYKGDKATEKYGEKGKNGVVIITTKK